MKGVKEGEAVLSAGEAYEDVIAVLNHVPAGEGGTNFAA